MNFGFRRVAPILAFSILVLSGILPAREAPAQNRRDKKQLREAEQYFLHNRYDRALPLYHELYLRYPNNPVYSFLTGVCFLESLNEKHKSIAFLERATQSRDTIPEAFYFLAQAYHVNHKFNKAIQYYQYFKKLVLFNEEGLELVGEVNRRIEMCGYAKRMVSSPVKVKIENLGENINSKWGDYVPVISADESVMIFTSRRAGSTGELIDDGGEFYEDVYYSFKDGEDWQRTRRIDSVKIVYNKKKKIKKSKLRKDTSFINSIYHDAAIGLSADGQKLFIYKSQQHYGDIFICVL